MNRKSALISILEQAGPERIRRPVYDRDGQLLARGVAYEQDGEILRDMEDIRNVDFICMDFTAPALKRTFDLSMLIDFIGKGVISLGLQPFLDAAERMVQQTMLLSARSHYNSNKHFEGNVDSLIRLYSAAYIRDGNFYLAEYITEYFKERWQKTVLS